MIDTLETTRSEYESARNDDALLEISDRLSAGEKVKLTEAQSEALNSALTAADDLSESVQTLLELLGF